MKSLLVIFATLALVACGNKQDAPAASPAPVAAPASAPAPAPAPAVAPATQQK